MKLVDFAANTQAVTTSIDSLIPDKAFSGYGVINLTEWYPIFDLNSGSSTGQVYIDASVQLGRTRHPDWSSDKIMDQSRIDFETAAR